MPKAKPKSKRKSKHPFRHNPSHQLVKRRGHSVRELNHRMVFAMAKQRQFGKAVILVSMRTEDQKKEVKALRDELQKGIDNKD